MKFLIKLTPVELFSLRKRRKKGEKINNLNNDLVFQHYKVFFKVIVMIFKGIILLFFMSDALPRDRHPYK